MGKMADENQIRLVFPSFSPEIEANVHSKYFPDGECYVRIPDLEQCRGKKVLVMHRMYPNHDSAIFQLILALEELTKYANEISAFLPYFPYARQDKKVLEGEVKSSEALCKVLCACGLRQVIAYDCHFLKKEGMFEYGGLKIRNLSASESLIAYFRKKESDLTVISPDIGASYLVQGHGGLSMKKKRGGYSHEQETVHRKIESMENDFSVDGKNILIVDDMIAGGGTMVRAVQKCLEGGAKKVYCAATHGQFLEGAGQKILDAGALEVISTNSIKTGFSKIDILDISKGLI